MTYSIRLSGFASDMNLKVILTYLTLFFIRRAISEGNIVSSQMYWYFTWTGCKMYISLSFETCYFNLNASAEFKYKVIHFSHVFNVFTIIISRLYYVQRSYMCKHTCCRYFTNVSHLLWSIALHIFEHLYWINHDCSMFVQRFCICLWLRFWFKYVLPAIILS